MNGWVRNDKSQENILWETVRDYALTFPEKVSCAIEEFSDDLFTVSENQLIVPEI
ncbi:MAG: hypothetical protein Q7K42_00180 [Candidatus Diapherotrites archaeon]|nr:hypothetical protein [Candidatus Diapherotrites archaeon]